MEEPLFFVTAVACVCVINDKKGKERKQEVGLDCVSAESRGGW